MYSGKIEERIFMIYNAQKNFKKKKQRRKKKIKLLLPTFLKNGTREEGGMPGFEVDAFFTLTLSEPSDSLASSNALRVPFVPDDS